MAVRLKRDNGRKQYLKVDELVAIDHTWLYEKSALLKLTTSVHLHIYRVFNSSQWKSRCARLKVFDCRKDKELYRLLHIYRGTAVAQRLRWCATNRKVAGSVPAGVSGNFIDIKSFRSHYGPGVDSASNRNEYQEHFLGVKAAGA